MNYEWYYNGREFEMKATSLTQKQLYLLMDFLNKLKEAENEQ